MADRIKNYQQEADQITTLKAIRTDLGVTPSSYTPDATVVTKDRVVTFAQAEEELVVLGDVERGVRNLIGDVNKNENDIANIKSLLQGHLYDYQTDTTSAYTKSVPSGAMPYAGIEKVGGKTIVWNQLVQNGNFADSTGWNVIITGATISVADNIATITYNSGTLKNYHPALKSSNITCYKNHKYLISFDIKFSKQGKADFASPIANYQSIVVEANTWHKERRIQEKTTDTLTGYFYIGDSKAPDNFDVGDTIQYKNIMIIDLTLLYGAGNEPSTVAEFEAMFPASYYPYNAGTLLSAVVTDVVSKDSNNATLQTFPIPTAIRNLEGYGWSAGSVYNYIDFERKVFVKNVGSRAYASGDESDSTVVTDMTTTYYPLTTAVETDISAYLTDDNLINVEAGGILTFPNSNGADYQIPVPSEETYMIDLQEAINNG